MSQKRTLLEVKYHSDDDTGMYRVGEIDFGIWGTLDEYLKRYGRKGKEDIVGTLGYLIYEVERKFREIPRPQSDGQSQCSRSVIKEKHDSETRQGTAEDDA